MTHGIQRGRDEARARRCLRDRRRGGRLGGSGGRHWSSGPGLMRAPLRTDAPCVGRRGRRSGFRGAVDAVPTTAPGSDSVPAGSPARRWNRRRATPRCPPWTRPRPPVLAAPKVCRGLGDFVAGLRRRPDRRPRSSATVGSAISGDERRPRRRPHDSRSAFAGQFLAYGIARLVVLPAQGRRVPAPRLRAARAAPGLVGACRSASALPSARRCSCCRCVHLVDTRTRASSTTCTTPRGAKLAVIVIAAGILAPVFEELALPGPAAARAAAPHGRPTGRSCVRRWSSRSRPPASSPSLGTLAVVPALFGLGAISGVAGGAQRRPLAVDPAAHGLQPARRSLALRAGARTRTRTERFSHGPRMPTSTAAAVVSREARNGGMHRMCENGADHDPHAGRRARARVPPLREV